MKLVNVTEFRQHLPAYLDRVAMGERFQITVKGRVVARLEADRDEAELAWERMKSYRASSVVGDVVSPVENEWSFDSDHV